MTPSIENEIAKCAKCGKCRSVCPVFFETKAEGMVARGRVNLAEEILAGHISDTAKARRYLYGCLKCLRCAEGCPSGVRFDIIIGEMRSRVGGRVGMPWLTRAATRMMLARRGVLDFAVRAMSLFQHLLPRRREGKMRHLPLMFMDSRNIPDVSGRSVLASFADYYGPADAKRKVAIFTGCLINYAYPEIARAMLKVFNHLGVGVYIPKGQMCCGAPSDSLGDHEMALRLAEMNARAFGALDVEAVVVACASGGAMLKKTYPELLGRDKPLGAPVVDFSEYVARHADEIEGRFGGRLSWHDPCHLKFVQGIAAEPRRVLARVGEFADFEGADYCCGMGGVFSAFFPGLSMKIAARKTAAIRAAAPETLVTGCPGCMMQMRDRLAEAQSPVRVMHIAEVLAAAIAGKADR